MVQKTKLNSDARTKFGSRDEEFVESLLDVDFNNRSEESQYK